MELMLMKTPAGALVPADSESQELLGKLPVGQGLRVKYSRARNLQFHRKMFALFKLAFDAWEPDGSMQYKGQPVAKDFDRFRKDMTILAGFFNPVVNVRGEIRLEAESLSFASMKEERFEQVFKAVLTAVWTRVLQTAGYRNEQEVERVLEELLRFEQ